MLACVVQHTAEGLDLALRILAGFGRVFDGLERLARDLCVDLIHTDTQVSDIGLTRGICHRIGARFAPAGMQLIEQRHAFFARKLGTEIDLLWCLTLLQQDGFHADEFRKRHHRQITHAGGCSLRSRPVKSLRTR